jgi:pantoate--beta-alanine ligase
MSQTLSALANAIRGGHTDYAALEAQAMKALRTAGWKPDYVVARRRVDLQAPQPGDALVVLAAAKLGTTRLIDNLEV